jgi:hypothetical protein
MTLVQSIVAQLWQRFLWLGWIGKLFAVAMALYGTGWVLGNLGLHGMGRELGTIALYIAAFPITALIIRWLWRDATAHHRK